VVTSSCGGFAGFVEVANCISHARKAQSKKRNLPMAEYRDESAIILRLK
jgi:hypothetical protein